MEHIELKILGVSHQQVEELMEDLRSINGIDRVGDIKELSGIEFKELATTIFIELGTVVAGTVVGNLISHYIIKFLEKEKSLDKKPIVINHKNIQIVQGDSKQEVENKVNIIINNYR